ncbi:MAG: hypothetical protein WAO71_13810 [Gallionella sp.]
MNRLLQMLKLGITNLFHWDFLIAMLPMIFYGLGFFAYGGHASYAYWNASCIGNGRGYFDGMINATYTFETILSSSYVIYFFLKARELLVCSNRFKSLSFYAQTAVAIPDIFIASTLILVFFLPHEWSSTHW